MRIAIAVVVSLLAISASSQAQRNESLSKPPLRSPWEWTVDERLADRLNPEQIRVRNAAYADAVSQRGSSSAVTGAHSDAARNDSSVLTYEIDGRRNPELFLTHELFDRLLIGLASDGTMRTKQRAFYGPFLRGLGYDETAFWASLESVSSGYLAVRDTATEGDVSCVARYQALQAARRLFGQQRFDRLLYVVVAPNVQHSTSTMDRNHGEALRRAEMGCQQ